MSHLSQSGDCHLLIILAHIARLMSCHDVPILSDGDLLGPHLSPSLA